MTVSKSITEELLEEIRKNNKEIQKSNLFLQEISEHLQKRKEESSEYLTTEAVATLLNKTSRTIANYCRNGKLRSLRRDPKGPHLITRESVNSLLNPKYFKERSPKLI